MNDVSQSVIKSGINDGYQSKRTMSVNQSSSQESKMDTGQNEQCQSVSHQVRPQRWIPVKMNDVSQSVIKSWIPVKMSNVSQSVIKSGLNDGYQSK